MGTGAIRIIIKHLLPQLAPTSVALLMLRTYASMITEAALNFLDFGDSIRSRRKL